MGFSSIHVGTKRIQVSVPVTNWKEGAFIQVDFGHPLEGRVDQGNEATLQAKPDARTATQFDFELWERPRKALHAFTFFVLYNGALVLVGSLLRCLSSHRQLQAVFQRLRPTSTGRMSRTSCACEPLPSKSLARRCPYRRPWPVVKRPQ